MKTTGVSGIPKIGLLDFLGHPNTHTVLNLVNCPNTLDWGFETSETLSSDVFLLLLHWPTNKEDDRQDQNREVEKEQAEKGKK